MAPLPPESTPRYRVVYTGNGHQHTQEWRSHLSPSAMDTFLGGVWTDMDALLYDTVIDDVLFAADGSNIFNSVTMTITGANFGSGSGSVSTAPYFISYIGRSSDGRRLRVYWYNVNVLGVDYRFGAGENANVDATIADLIAAGSDLVTIGDLAPVWKSYANGGVSAYWQRKVRP